MRVLETIIPRTATALVVGVAVAGCLASESTMASIAQARDQAAQFRREVKAVAAAEQAGDPAKASKHQAAARAALERALQLFEGSKLALHNDPSGLLDYAGLQRYEGNYDQVAELLKRVTQLDPGRLDAWLGMGDALSRLGPSRASDAERALRKGLSVASSSAEKARAYVALGALYRREGLYDLARENVDRALQADPSNVRAKMLVAVLDVRDGRILNAEKTLASLAAVSPDLDQELSRSLKESLDGFSANRGWIPDTSADHLAYAEILFRAGRLRECLGPLERSVKLDPKNVVAWNLLGSVSQILHDPERAREAFERSLALKPGDVRTQQSLKELGAGGSAGSGKAEDRSQ